MLKNYEELRKINVSEWTDKRDNAEYLNWAKCIDLLHENGAKDVYFEPIVNEKTGSSLFMTEQVFTDSKNNTNRVYETAVKVVVDDKEWIFRGPVTNGSNPVKDNSMTQQRLWNCQTRLFVKCIAIHTGLGFDLWLKEEDRNSKQQEADLSKHNIYSIKERVQELVTSKLQKGLAVPDIAKELNMSEEQFRAYFAYYETLDKFEKAIAKL